MSTIAEWSYASVATVWPFVSHDSWSGATVYGSPYRIRVGWEGKAEQRKDSDGAEFTTRNIFWTESRNHDTGLIVPAPKRLDKIAKGEHADASPVFGAEEIRSVTDWEMTAFGDIPDYEITT